MKLSEVLNKGEREQEWKRESELTCVKKRERENWWDCKRERLQDQKGESWKIIGISPESKFTRELEIYRGKECKCKRVKARERISLKMLKKVTLFTW